MDRQPSDFEAEAPSSYEEKVLCQQQPTSKYKSKFESQFADNLTKKKIIFTYETISIDYEITCTYRPDFILNNFIVETKGYFSKEDRRKHLAIKEKRPDLDIRFCFQNSRTKLSKAKNSISVRDKWCEQDMGSNTAQKFIKTSD